jgi:transposase
MSSAPVRKPYPSDVTEEEWSLVVPYLTLMKEGAPQREHPRRELFNALRYVIRYGVAWRAMPNDFRPWHAVHQQAHRWLAAGCFEALAQDLRAVLRLAADIQDATGDTVSLAYVDQGYTGERAAEAAAAEGIALEVVKLPEAKRGFVLLPRRWVVERSFAWAPCCRRLVKDYERYATTLASFHVIAFIGYMLKQALILMQSA